MSRPDSHASSRSKASAASSRRSYRVVSATSQVDEMLFGSPSRPNASRARSATQQSNAGLSDFFSGGGTTQHKPSSRRMGRQDRPEAYEIVTKDGIRKITVPRKERNVGGELVLTQAEYSRIRQNAFVKTKEQLRQEREAAMQERDAKAEEAARRRAELQALDRTRQEAQPISDLDLEAEGKRNHVRSNAQRLREEEEDEIKRLNEMILQAKVYAIRDAQMTEKVALQREEKELEAQLDEMMERDRRQGLEDQERVEVELKLKRVRDAQQIRHQIEERELQALLEEELREQETQALIQRMEEMKVEDAKAAEERRIRAKKLMEDATRCNEEALRLRQQLLEAEKEEDLKVVEYLRQKAEKDAEIEEEKKRAAAERERELARLRAQQEMSTDQVAERHALAAKRAQDERERQLRREEREKERKRQETLAELHRSREEQLRAKERVIAHQTRQERAEFERVLRAQQELIAAEEAKKQQEHAQRQTFQKEIRHQIKEKEAERVDQRKAFFEEGRKLDEEAQARRQRLDAVKQRKLAELRAAGVDDKYLGPIKRMIHAPQTTKFST